MDLEKAYDMVPHIKLWEYLERVDISKSLIKAIQNLYRHSLARIKIKNKVSTEFRITKGLRQGCCLSPTLFKIYLEEALKGWKKKCRHMGVLVGDKNIYTLQFADDQIILAEDYDDIEYMSRKLIEEYEKSGLKFNFEKSHYMVIGGKKQNLILENKGVIKYSNKYKYLGVTITDDGRNHVEMKERLKKGKYAISTLNQVLWDNKIRIETKHKIYKSIVRSTTLYGAETWQLQNAFKNKFLALEMDYWRRSAGISRRDKIRNDIIREKMQVKNDIVEDIFTKQLIWYGHMMRMNTERLPRLAYDWTPSRRRKRGRPMTTWKKGILEAMERRQLGEDLWRDRGEWYLAVRYIYQ